MKVLWRELSTLYDAHRLRSPSRLAALPMQYADYARWQREWLQGKCSNANSPTGSRR